MKKFTNFWWSYWKPLVQSQNRCQKSLVPKLQVPNAAENFMKKFVKNNF